MALPRKHMINGVEKKVSAGLDEVPMVYKTSTKSWPHGKDLVTILVQFDPKLVKMAPHNFFFVMCYFLRQEVL